MKVKQIEDLIWRLETKYKNELNAPHWSDSEIEELSGMLRRDVQELMRIKRDVSQCLDDLYRQRDGGR